jgi:hypothetical protein
MFDKPLKILLLSDAAALSVIGLGIIDGSYESRFLILYLSMALWMFQFLVLCRAVVRQEATRTYLMTIIYVVHASLVLMLCFAINSYDLHRVLFGRT